MKYGALQTSSARISSTFSLITALAIKYCPLSPSFANPFTAYLISAYAAVSACHFLWYG